MPYIKQVDREKFLIQISELRFQVSKDPQKRPGEMNYIISQLISLVYGRELKYYEYNEIMGVLDSAKMEFYRAQVAPYEDKKIAENGEVV
jgi:hypothetical protein